MQSPLQATKRSFPILRVPGHSKVKNNLKEQSSFHSFHFQMRKVRPQRLHNFPRPPWSLSHNKYKISHRKYWWNDLNFSPFGRTTGTKCKYLAVLNFPSTSRKVSKVISPYLLSTTPWPGSSIGQNSYSLEQYFKRSEMNSDYRSYPEFKIFCHLQFCKLFRQILIQAESKPMILKAPSASKILMTPDCPPHTTLIHKILRPNAQVP